MRSTVFASAAATLGLVAEEFEHLLHVCDVGVAQFDRLGVGLEVIVAVGQAESALIGVGDLLVGVVRVLNGFEAEQHVVGDHIGGDVGDLGLGIDIGDLLQPRFERLRSAGFDGLLVGAGSVVVANFLIDRTAVRIRHGRSLQNSAQARQVLILHFGIRVPGRLVGRNGIVLDPAAAGIGEEIHARINAAVHARNIEGRSVFFRGWLLGLG